ISFALRENAKGRPRVDRPMVDGPALVVERLLQHRVTLELKDTRTLTGKLVGVDEHMNLVLEDADEKTSEVSRHLGRVVLRGSNVVTLNAPQGAAGKSA
ncbi:MAG: LSM domain-containing protein, partial [Candidatus Lutacidiplasmatales archaeon]